jgi:hypothetical protein
MRPFMLCAIVSISSLLSPLVLEAQTPQDCSALMQFGIYDRYRTFTTQSQFRLIQNFFKQYQFSSRQEAEAKAGTLGLNIVDVLGLNLGGQSSSSSFQQWVNALLSTSYDQLSASSSLSQSIDTISGKITDLVGQCINQKGLHAYLIPAADNMNFTYTIAFIPSSDARPNTTGKFAITPATVAATCSPSNIVGQQITIGPQGISVSCRRTATETVTIVSNTQDGSPSLRYDAYVVPQPTVAFTASPTTIDSGASSTLNWDVANAANIELSPGFGVVQPNGSLTVNPSRTQQYTLAVRGLDGQTRNTFVTVNVNPPPLTLNAAAISFHTNDDDRDHDTNESIYISCAGGSVASLNGTFGDQRFPDQTDNGPFQVGVSGHPSLVQISTCQLHIDQSPKGNDTWKFNVHLHLVFSNGDSSQSKDYDWGGQVLHNQASAAYPL